MSILTFIRKKKDQKVKLSLSFVLQSFGIGLSLYFAIASLFVYLDFFNLFTGYLLFVGIDLFFLTRVVFERYRSDKLFFSVNSAKEWIRKYWFYFPAFIIILILQDVIQNHFIDLVLPFPAYDPYYWFSLIWDVRNTGGIDWALVKAKPAGLPLLGAGITLLTNSYYTTFYAMKYLSFFLFTIDLLVVFEIARKLFRNVAVVFFVTLTVMGFSNLVSRSVMLLPSIPATTLGFILLLVIAENKLIPADLSGNSKILFKENLRNPIPWTIGILFSGVFTSHMLYALLLFVPFVLFKLYLGITELLKSERGSRGSKFKTLFIEFIVFLLIIVVTIALLQVPFFIFVSQYHDFLSAIQYYFYFISPIRFQNPFLLTVDLRAVLYSVFNFLGTKFSEIWLVSNSETFFSDILGGTSGDVFYIFYRYSLRVGIVLIILGCLVPTKGIIRNSEKLRSVINYIKLTFIFVVAYYIAISFFQNVPLISPIVGMMDRHRGRVFELLAGYWAVLCVLPFYQLKHWAKKLFAKLSEHRKIIPHPRLVKLLAAIEVSGLIFVGFYFYSTNPRWIIYENLYGNEHMDAILYMGEYYHKNLENTGAVYHFDKRAFNDPLIFSALKFDNLSIGYFSASSFYGKYSDFKSQFSSTLPELVCLHYWELQPILYYVFEYYPVDSEPGSWSSNFQDESEMNSSSSIQYYNPERNHVVEMQDAANESSLAGFTLSNENMEKGTIWFQVNMDNVSQAFEFSTYSNGTEGYQRYIRLGISDGSWKFQNGTNYSNLDSVSTPSDNSWYLVVIDFQLTPNQNGGLDQYQWHVSIDNVDIGTFFTETQGSAFDYLNFQTSSAPLKNNYTVCIDELWIRNSQFETYFLQDFEVLYQNSLVVVAREK